MGGFFITRADADEAAVSRRLAEAEQQFGRHGFGPPSYFATPSHRGFHVGPIHGGPASFLRRGDDFVAVAGTLVFDGRMGEEALERLLDSFRLPFEPWDRLSGQFALLVHRDGATGLLTDYFGAFQLFHDPEQTIFSTSFLATVGSLPRVRLSAQGVYEFAFNVFPTGDSTVLDEVRRLGPDVQLQLGETVRRHQVAKPLPATVDERPASERVPEHAATLDAIVEPHVRQYGDRMQCPLSGGIDSRLALALLRRHGVRPHVYVYGAPGDPDVEIARRIADGEGFELELFDKSAWRRVDPDEFVEIVERNWQETDALVTDGGLFDNGGNAAARHARQAGGQLAVSGGCGEIFRNFFYLPDRWLRVSDVVRAFYARYSPADVTRRFDGRAFEKELTAKGLAALGLERDAPLPRPVIEQLYPRMRCRAFFGREISLVGRHGGYLMPFLDHRIVAKAVTLPQPLKRAGAFEAQLLAAVDQRLAAYPSTYGHDFLGPPSRGHVREERGTVARPVWLRKRSYRLRRWLGQLDDDHGGLLTPIYLGRVIDLHFPAMRSYFNVSAVRDRGLYRRIATLEYLAERLGSRLVEA